MSGALIIAEHDDIAVAAATRNVVAAAAKLGVDRIDIAVLGRKTEALAVQASRLPAVDRVLRIEREENTPTLAAVWSPQIAAIGAGYSHILTAATTFGKDLMPRVAAELGVGMLSEITAVEAAYRFRRPVYAGNAITRVAADPGRILCATVRPSAFPSGDGGGQATIERASPSVELPQHTRFVERRAGAQSGPDLQTATRVVAGGRGFGSPGNFALLEQLAAALDAAIGASRAAVDSGWASNDMQVGQTGKIIAPALYVAIGISGAIQHLTGIRDAGTVVAINTDGEAPICAAADIVLTGDLLVVVPELVAALNARSA